MAGGEGAAAAALTGQKRDAAGSVKSRGSKPLAGTREGKDNAGTAAPNGRDEEGNIEQENTVVVAVVYKAKTLGLACWDEEKSSIRLAQVLVAAPELRQTVHEIKTHLEPTLFLIDPSLLSNADFCKLLMAPVIEGTEEYAIKVIKSKAWDFQASVTLICESLKVSGDNVVKNLSSAAMTEETTHGRRMLFTILSSVINFNDEPLCVRALGALTAHLQSTVFHLDTTVVVNSVERFSLEGYVRVDPIAFSALQIFQEERHPNVLAGKGRSKEGFSLMAILDRTRSAPGRNLLKEWLMKPLTSVERIMARQNAVDLLMQLESKEVIQHLHRFLPKVADVAKCLLRLRRGQMAHNDFVKVQQSLEHIIKCHECVNALYPIARTRPEWDEAVCEIVQRISAEPLFELAEHMNNVIDLELTLINSRTVIRIGCSEDLDRLRARFDSLEEFLTGEARKVLEEMPALQHLAVTYLPQIGYLVVISRDQQSAVSGDDRFQFVFLQDDQIYYKTARMRKLDDELGDMQATIRDLEDGILRDLVSRILDDEVPLTQAASACAELDVLVAFSMVAFDLNFVKPEITNERVIIIKDGRHPLQELTVETFIPNDAYLTGDRPLAMITGPNFSGKSVYLKSLGILTWLAHIGSFIPASKAVIGIVDGIYTRLSSLESAAVQMSTFAIELNQMNMILRSATVKSLVLVDEFGRGTSSADGVALLVASVKELLRKGCRAAVTTHLLECFAPSLLPTRVTEDLSFRMDIHVPDKRACDDEQGYVTVCPLFKLSKGVSAASDGFSCAVLAGVPIPIVRRAEHIQRCHHEGVAVVAPPQPVWVPPGAEAEPSMVCRYNPMCQDLLRALLEVEDWKTCTDEQLEAFFALLKKSV